MGDDFVSTFMLVRTHQEKHGCESEMAEFDCFL